MTFEIREVTIPGKLKISICPTPIIGLISVIPYEEWKLTEEERQAPIQAIEQAYKDGLFRRC